MYSEEIVNERLALVQQELGFQPVYHSVQEVDDFISRMREKYVDLYASAETEGKGSKDPTQTIQLSLSRALADPQNPRLNADEVRFIQNETALAMCDAAYFLSRYYFIKTPQKIQRFTFLPGQKCYFNVVAEMERLRAAIEMITCKARQHGISTITEGLIIHRANFGYGVNAVVASADQTKTGKMAQMTMLGYDMIPWWMRALSTRRVESDRGMLVFGGIRSGISFQHGSQTSGIARGDTVKCYHLSEVASYSNPDEQIEASLFRCVHPHPDVFGVLESTAEGDTGWFYETYQHSKKAWASGGSRLCALFLPWFVGTDKYPTATWIRTRPVPRDWRPIPETRQMTAKAQLFVRNSPVLARVLGSNWTLPREQQWFWEVNFLEQRAKGLEKLWFQEMPTDDKEAFQGSYDSVFGAEIIESSFQKRETSYWVYGIVGQSIEERNEPDPDEVDYSQARVNVQYKSHKGNYRWEFIPLKWVEPFTALDELRDNEEHMGKLFVYHPPEAGYYYSIGVDTSNGIGEDGSCISVCRMGRTPQEQDVQAAEFRDNRVGHTEAFAWVMAIAAYYSRYMGDCPEVEPEMRIQWREPYVAVEQIAAVGDTVNVSMRAMGYSNFHRMGRYDSVPNKNKKKHFSKEGWFTGAWSRPILTDTFKTLVMNGWYKINSPYTLWEMDHWEVHLTSQTGKAKYEHNIDATDDGIFANAMAVFCPRDRKGLAERSTSKFAVRENTKLPKLNFDVPKFGLFQPTTVYTRDRR